MFCRDFVQTSSAFFFLECRCGIPWTDMVLPSILGWMVQSQSRRVGDLTFRNLQDVVDVTIGKFDHLVHVENCLLENVRLRDQKIRQGVDPARFLASWFGAIRRIWKTPCEFVLWHIDNMFSISPKVVDRLLNYHKFLHFLFFKIWNEWTFDILFVDCLTSSGSGYSFFCFFAPAAQSDVQSKFKKEYPEAVRARIFPPLPLAQLHCIGEKRYISKNSHQSGCKNKCNSVLWCNRL